MTDTPQHSEEQAAELAHLEAMAAAEPIPEGQAPAPTAASDPKAETTALLLPLVAIICAKLVPNWGITEEEQQQLAGAYALVVDKYFPDMNFGVEVNALLLTAMVVVPRMNTPRVIEGESKKVPNEPQPGAA